MEFGRVDEKKLANIHFALPPEPVGNNKFLGKKPTKNARIYLGCAKWGYPEWAGRLYPPNIKEKDHLQHYLQHYNAVELNATHFKIIGNAGIKKWALQASEKDFKFCPKMYQGITHAGNLKSKGFLTNEFIRGIRGFEEHLGPVLVQVNDKFTPKRKPELLEFLSSLPNDIEFFMELRHPGWFKDETIWPVLADLGVGAVITDTAGRRDCAHMHLTTNKTFIRFVGNSLHPSDYQRCDEWVRRMKYWLSNGLREIYFFMHMHDEATSPELTIYLVEKIEEEIGIELIKPKLYEGTDVKKQRRSRWSLFSR